VLAPIIAVFVRSPEAYGYVAAGFDAKWPVKSVRSVADLLDVVVRSNIGLVITEAGDDQGRSNAAAVAAIRARNERLPILVVCSLAVGQTHLVPEVVRAGATGLLFRGIDDSRHIIRTALQQAARHCAAERVYRTVLPLLPAAAVPFLRFAISRAADEPTVTQAAQEIGVDRKTLRNWLHFSRVSPTEFLNWIRLALAIAALEGTTYSAERIAVDLGFPSGTAFRNMLQRYTGRRAGELRAAGSFEIVLEAFAAKLRAESAPALTPMSSREDRIARRGA
jgi:AraC-like DNA-binding protein